MKFEQTKTYIYYYYLLHTQKETKQPEEHFRCKTFYRETSLRCQMENGQLETFVLLRFAMFLVFIIINRFYNLSVFRFDFMLLL